MIIKTCDECGVQEKEGETFFELAGMDMELVRRVFLHFCPACNKKMFDSLKAGKRPHFEFLNVHTGN